MFFIFSLFSKLTFVLHELQDLYMTFYIACNHVVVMQIFYEMLMSEIEFTLLTYYALIKLISYNEKIKYHKMDRMLLYYVSNKNIFPLMSAHDLYLII